MNCQHEHKYCKKLGWGKSFMRIIFGNGTEEHRHAMIDLWFCTDCESNLIFNWSIGRYEGVKI